MQKRERRHGLCLLIFLWISTLNSYSQGLLFYGNEKRIDEKSSYAVFQENNIPVFSDKLHLSFDYAIKDPQSSGYIFSIADKESGKTFSLTYLDERHRACTFSFNEEGRRTLSAMRIHTDSIDYLWTHIAMTLYMQTGEAEVSVGKYTQRFSGLDLDKKSFAPSIHFGKYEHILDLASFAIRNLTISDSKREWNIPLNESHGHKVHDDKGSVIGWVENPVWLINQSYYWKELCALSSATSSGLNFNDAQQRFIIYNQDSLFIYSLPTGKLTGTTYQNPLPVPLFLGMNFLDKDEEKLYVYELNNINRNTIAALDLSTNTWENVSALWIERQLHHHAGFYDPNHHTYTVFGGYGSRRYSNTFLTYDIRQDRWDTLSVSGDKITPRYFSGLAVTPNHTQLYLYGGMGNEFGDQNVGRNYYYDLYKVDLDTRHVSKLWTQPAPDVNRVAARNMILSTDQKYLYMLGYPEYMSSSYLQLYRMSVSDGSYEAVGDSIPIISEEIATNANLFYNASRGEFYCTIQEYDKSGNVSTRIYSLATPPVTLAQVEYYHTTLGHYTGGLWYLLLICFVVGIGVWGWLSKRKRKSSSTTVTEATSAAHSQVSPDGEAHPQRPLAEEVLSVTDVFAPSHNAIYLFGNFTVIDRNERDITYMFSPKLRMIFSYILLHSILKNGVLSSDMNELFWADKADDKVKNLKGVTMNHIRKILQEMDGIELTYHKGYFKLLFDKDFYCDYLSYISLIGKEEQTASASHCVVELTNIFSRGKFLSTMESELFDYFKQKVENFVLQFLPDQINKMYRVCKYDAVIRLCNILFTADALSELALKYYICAYQKMGMPDKAIKRYNSFAKDYKREMDEEYHTPYETISDV